jgi:hypothetical protein
MGCVSVAYVDTAGGANYTRSRPFVPVAAHSETCALGTRPCVDTVPPSRFGEQRNSSQAQLTSLQLVLAERTHQYVHAYAGTLAVNPGKWLHVYPV